MKDTDKMGVDITLTRRQMLGTVGAAASDLGPAFRPRWTN